MRTILVPVDFSSYSDNALLFACDLAKKIEGKIVIMNIIESLKSSSFSVSGSWDLDSQQSIYMDQLIKATSRKLQEYTEDPRFEGIKMEYHAHIAEPGEIIAKVIVNHKADLIVMGTLGSSGLDELFIGSNTEKVVRYADVPVISVPDEARFKNINNVVFATNLSDIDGKVLDRLKIGLEYFDAHLHLLWVNTPHVHENTDDMQKSLEEFAAKHDLKNYSVHTTKGLFADAGIMNYASEIDADMIAMATGGRKGIQYLFSGSLAEDVVNHSCLPVWTFSPVDEMK